MPPEHPPSKPTWLIVIAGSAGALSALRAIARELTPNLDAAVVVLTHRPPDYRSHLAEILRRSGPLPATDAQDGEPLEAGRIYVVPSGHTHLRVAGDTLRLVDGPPIAFNRPAADPLFESAAQAFGDRAIGVILSGGSQNGSAGLGAIHAAGGATLVQDLTEAEQATMPGSALRAVPTSFVAPARVLGARLAALCRSPGGGRSP
jgi:two-component system chemotaxis response regulator CheB